MQKNFFLPIQLRKLKVALILLIIGIFSVASLRAQGRKTISGYITDASTGEQLIGVNVYDSKNGIGISSNEYGFYSLSMPSGACELRVTFIGYEIQRLAFNLNADTTINFKLSTQAVEFEEVEVTAEVPKVEQSQMSVVDLPLKQLDKIPVILGEPDILKVIQLLPGVQSGTEGTSGIYVRGGAADQNLFLLDGVPVYNVSHLFGFFSVFNPGSVKSVKLYKGGFPARYGGRLSSVMDVRMKEGNDQEFKGDVSIGLISSRINLEGPLIKGKSSFVLSARRTYVDVLSRPFIAMINAGMEDTRVRGGYFFYDLNGKLNYKFSDRSRLFLSAYLGHDKLYAKEDYAYTNENYNYETQTTETQKYEEKIDMDINWGNRIAALRWNYVLSNKLFSNTTVTYSRYRFNTNYDYVSHNVTTDHKDYDKFDYFSSIRDFSAKVDFDYSPHPDHAIKFGTGYTLHCFKPGVQSEKIASVDTVYSTSTPGNTINANEAYLYIEDDMNIGERCKINAGLHFSAFNVQGKTYLSLQPRISARYKLYDNVSLKASYAKMDQHVHLLSTSAIDLPTDLWVPVTDDLAPPVSHQVALGTSIRLPYTLDMTVEGFYKDMSNLIAYKDGASFSATASTNWDEKVELGEGWAYGVEFMLEKTVGQTTGWLSYTWSKSERQFDEINNGEVFPAHYDRRNDISFVMTHVFSERFDVGMTWVFSTGNAVTLGAYEYPLLPGSPNVDGTIIPKDYGGRNSYRMPSYHRMDIGMNFHKVKKRGVRTWNISVYNAYNNQNPFMLKWGTKHIKTETTDEYGNVFYSTKSKNVLQQVSLFPIIPSISYSFKF